MSLSLALLRFYSAAAVVDKILKLTGNSDSLLTRKEIFSLVSSSPIKSSDGWFYHAFYGRWWMSSPTCGGDGGFVHQNPLNKGFHHISDLGDLNLIPDLAPTAPLLSDDDDGEEEMKAARETERRSTTPKEARRASHRLWPPSGQTTSPASPPPPSAFASAPDARNNARKWRVEDVIGVLSSGHRSRRFLRGFAPLLVGFHPSKVVIVVVLGERKRLTGGLLYFCGGRIADGGRQPLCAAATMYGGEFGGVWWFFV
ncbi:hypothetical protein ACLB2K_072367 [Fragaria x ananassa]